MRIDLPTRESVIATASKAAFGRPLVTNVMRSWLVEAILSETLPAGWTWCAADYASWDFEHGDGTRLEVKQSAARQSWHDDNSEPSKPAFDIKPRKGRWEGGSRWIAEPGRNAEIYVFAFHPLRTSEADHRDPDQWQFYVVPTSSLPVGDTLSLPRTRQLSDAHTLANAVAAVEVLRERLGTQAAKARTSTAP